LIRATSKKEYQENTIMAGIYGVKAKVTIIMEVAQKRMEADLTATKDYMNTARIRPG
jgi:hypothetical protein